MSVREALEALVKRIDKEKSMHSWGEWGELTAALAALAAQPAQKAVAWVTECDEIGDDGKPTRLRDLDWYESEIENLPVGTRLYPAAQPEQPPVARADRISQLHAEIRAALDEDEAEQSRMKETIPSRSWSCTCPGCKDAMRRISAAIDGSFRCVLDKP